VFEEGRRVLDEERTGFRFLNHAAEGRPDSTRIGRPLPFACDGIRLARESRSDEIHEATETAAIEGCEIVPDRRTIQGRVFHPRHESGRSEGFTLDVTHSSVRMPKGETGSQLVAANPGA
jgi:hypothetical protein